MLVNVLPDSFDGYCLHSHRVVITVVLLLLLMDVLSQELCGHCLQAQRSGEDTSSVKTLFGVTFEHAVCLIMSVLFC